MLHIGTPFFSDESDREKIGTSVAFLFLFFNLTTIEKRGEERYNERKSQRRIKRRKSGHKERNYERNPRKREDLICINRGKSNPEKLKLFL